MIKSEWVTDFRLKESGGPATVGALMSALNAYLSSVGLQPDDYRFGDRMRRDELAQRIPEKSRWLIAFAIDNDCEPGYYIEVAAVHAADQSYIGLGCARTDRADDAYAIAREAQRFLNAARWN